MYTPPWLFAQRPRDDGNSDLMRQMMLMNMRGRQDRRASRGQMKDAMMMQAAAAAMRHSFEGPQRDADRTLQRELAKLAQQTQQGQFQNTLESIREQGKAQGELLDKRLGAELLPMSKRLEMMETEMRRANALTDSQVQSNKAQEDLHAEQMKEFKRGGRVRDASAATNIADLGTDIRISKIEAQQQDMQTEFQKHQQEIMDIGDIDEMFNDYDPESEWHEINWGRAAEQAVESIFKSTRTINRKLKSNDPAEVAAGYEMGTRMMDRLKASGGGWFNPNIWSKGPMKEFRTLMDSSGTYKKSKEYRDRMLELDKEIRAVRDEGLTRKMMIYNMSSQFMNPRISGMLEAEMKSMGAAPPAGPPVPPPAPVSPIPGYQAPQSAVDPRLRPLNPSMADIERLISEKGG